MFAEHSLWCELWLNDEWVPAWVYYKLGFQWDGILRVEAQLPEGPRVWENREAGDFEDDLLVLLTGEGRREGPIWRMPVAMRIRREEVASFRRGMYEVSLRADARSRRDFSVVGRLTFEDGEVCEGWLLDRMGIPGVECCGTCRFGAHCIYGGADGMFGLHCFRDSPEIVSDWKAYQECWYAAEEVAFPHTPYLHFCPSYVRWTPEYQRKSPPDKRIDGE
jgi:hypothetical protein